MESKWRGVGFYNSMGYYIECTDREAFEFGYVKYITEIAYNYEFKK